MPKGSRLPTFNEVLAQAIADFAEHGYDDAERLVRWQMALKAAAQREMKSEQDMVQKMRRGLGKIFEKMVEQEQILTKTNGINRFTLGNLKPELRNVFQRRLLASVDLIKLNREQVMAKTLQRFSGWATSIPPGGSEEAQKKETKDRVRKGMAGLKFEERRVLIDQGNKLVSALNQTLAEGAGAIAAIWHSHYHQSNYNYREDHKERELKSKRLPFVVRGNWAIEKGLMKLAGSKYTDAMTQPAEEPFCRCYYEWIYSLRDLPVAMLTDKGKAALKGAG